MKMPPIDDPNSLLKTKALSGIRMEYTIGDECLVITDTSQTDVSKRRIEISWSMLSRFVSELQEIEGLMLKENKLHGN